MTKMIKLSLAAAVAVSALTTTASAGSLEDAIKDTTISGKAQVGYNVYEDNKVDTSANEVEYDFDLTLTTKVNDTISFTTGIQADHGNTRGNSTDKASTVKNWADVTADATTSSKASTDTITLTKLYFTAKTDVATVMVGKQKQPTPFLDDERGDGVVALVPAGPVTIAAGHFTGMTAPVSTDITAAAVIGTFGPVNASLWALNASQVANGYSLNLGGTFGPVNVDFTHSEMDYEDVNQVAALNKAEASLTKLIVSAKVADVNLVAGYGVTGDDVNGNGLGVDLTGDDDGKTSFGGEIIELDDHNDASAFLLGASMTFGQTTVAAQYIVADVDDGAVADIDAEELNLDITYAMSKNFSVTAEYAQYDADQSGAEIADLTKMELSLNYKF